MISGGFGWGRRPWPRLLIAAVACGSTTAVAPEQPEKTGPVSALLLRVTTSRPEVGPGDLLIIELTATNPLPIPIVAQVACPFPAWLPSSMVGTGNPESSEWSRAALSFRMAHVGPTVGLVIRGQ